MSAEERYPGTKFECSQLYNRLSLLGKIKSQGVRQMDDSAMIVRVKFKTPPDKKLIEASAAAALAASQMDEPEEEPKK